MSVIPVQTAGAHAVSGPTTSLNIGRDYWGAHNQPPMASVRGEIAGAPGVGTMVPSCVTGPRENIPSDLWMQVLSFIIKHMESFIYYTLPICYFL